VLGLEELSRGLGLAAKERKTGILHLGLVPTDVDTAN
jgi:hypothetical protein